MAGQDNGGTVTLTHTGNVADNFIVDYSGHQIWDQTAALPPDEITVTFQQPYKGSRWRTMRHYNQGRFSAAIKMCAGHTDGIIGSFYTCSCQGSPDMDQIEFLFLGKHKTHVQTNFWVDGQGGHEMFQELGFDASEDFHRYELDIRQDRISWLVDGKAIRVEERAKHNHGRFPWKPFYLYASVWDASEIAHGSWAGKCTWKDAPYYFRYKQVTVPSEVAGQCPFKPDAYKCEGLAREDTSLSFTSLQDSLQQFSTAAASTVKGIDNSVILTHTANKADNFAIDYSSHQIWDRTSALPSDEIVITFQNPYNGARWRTLRHYNDGYFSAYIKTCAGRADGIVSAFYTSSLEGPRDMDEIDFEFLGKNKTHVQTNFFVDGQGDHEMLHPLGFDTSADFHLYALDIRKERIIWLVDGRPIRVEAKSIHDKFPWKPFYVYGSVWDASDTMDGRWAGKCTWEDEPYHIHFKKVTVPFQVAEQCPYKPEPYKSGYGEEVAAKMPETCVPREAGGSASLILTHTGNKADNFVIDYSDHQIWDKTAALPPDEIIVTFQKPYNGARWRTMRHYNEGYFGAYIKMCAGDTNGIVGSFYTSSLEGPRDMDEIDFEFLGKDKTHIQTNFWVDGQGGHEMFQKLGFDASEDFHHYALDIRQDRITWLIDGKVIRVEEKAKHNKFPWKPFYLYASVWDASGIEHGCWAGKCTWADEPYYIHYKQVTVPLVVAEQCPYKPGAYKCGYGEEEPAKTREETCASLEAGKSAGLVLTHTRNKADNFAIDYSDHQIWDKTAALPPNEIIVTFQKPHNGARWRTTRHYNEGYFGAYIKMCAGDTNGIVGSFYTSSLEGPRDMDEIDFEFLGKDKTHIQTNFWVDGKGDHEMFQPLGFDASEDFHHYALDIRQDRIKWLIDGKVIRVEEKAKHDKFPWKPFYLYASVWEASGIEDGSWAGKCTWANEPYYIHYKQVTVPLEVAEQCPYKPGAYKCGCKGGVAPNCCMVL